MQKTIKYLAVTQSFGMNLGSSKKAHPGEKQSIQVLFSTASENFVSNSIAVEQSYCDENAPKIMLHLNLQ